MKKILFTILLISACFALAILIGCDENEPEGVNLTVSVTDFSSCKSFSKDTDNNVDSLSCVDYLYSSIERKLFLKHINAGFNCCPDDTYCEISLIGDTIVIEEFEETSDCDCNCLYDMNIEIGGVVTDSYIIKFIEPYSANQEEILFEINLFQDTLGSFCVTRTSYPWNLN